jgi:ABC-2 type transport system ATP-binding protein
MSATAIDARGLTKRYDEMAGVFDLDLEVGAGHILGLIGPSGSGKTTTVRLMAGLLDRDGGALTVLGHDPRMFDRAAQRRLGYLPQSTVLYPTLSLAENLDFVGSLYGLSRKDREVAARDLLEVVDLREHGARRLSDASGGMRRRLGLAAALMHSPDLVFLDEPTAGLDPILRRSIWDFLRDLRDEGTTLIVTTQYIGEAAYCDTIALLAEGRVIESGEPEHLRRAAYGGELIDIVFSTPVTGGALEAFSEALGANDLTILGARSVRLTVPDAGSVIPVIPDVASSQSIEVGEVERFLPEFDDVFVRIVERERGDAA